jgi:uncharacterized membrane protein
MKNKSAIQDNYRLGHWVGFAFKAGLYASLAMIVVGFIWSAAAGRAGPKEVGLPKLVSALFSGEPGALISLGVLVLMMTPFAAVIIAIVRFLIDRQRAWVIVSLLVLTMLALSIYKGLR